MRRIAGTVLVAALMGLAFAGHRLAATSEGFSGSSADVSAASTQLFGSLRAVPQMALWRRILEAEQRQDWHELRGLFDLVLTLTPKNALVVVQLAQTEALMAARNQPDSATEWLWVERGLDRLSETRPVVGNPGAIDDGIWTIGFYSGQRFPAKIAEWIWTEVGDDEARERAAGMAAAVDGDLAASGFLRDHWLGVKFEEGENGESRLIDFSETREFLALPEATRSLVLAAEMERWRALYAIAERGLLAMRGTGTRLVLEYVRSFERNWTFADDARRRELSVRVIEVLEGELRRLTALGDEQSAAMLQQMLDASRAQVE